MGKYSVSENRKVNKKVKTKKHVGVKVFLVLILVAIIITGCSFGFLKSKTNQMQHIELNVEELGIDETVDDNLKGYRNILLLGLDSRDMDNTKGSRSDAIIIVNINEKTKEVNLISVYRDTYLDIDGHGLDKVTHAHAYGGPTLTINTLNKNLDLNIKEFAAVNFETVADLIDLMGGIELDITNSEMKEMNQYISDTSKNTGISSKKLTTSGKQMVDGVQAVTYARIRKNTGGDEKRTDRMRTVLVKTFEKAKKMNLSKVNSIANAMLPEVQTNIKDTDILAIIPKMASYKINDSVGWPFDTKGITLDRWYGVPVTLEENVKRMYTEIFKIEDYTPSETVTTISNNIIKKTGYK